MRPFCLFLSLAMGFVGSALSQTPAEICALIHQLGSEKFKEREAAQKALKNMGKKAIPFLEHAEHSLNAEVATRAKKLTAPFREMRQAKMAAKVMPTTWGRTPWVDMLPSPECAAISHYLELAHKEGHKRDWAPHWTNYRAATRLYLADLARAGATEKELVDLLDRMAINERAWIQSHGQGYDPPIEMPDF